ncbi:hypothetical protein, partial [Bosea sp. (in: a-proteobacteria)]|uniref:hypothetical protein n=1 Tax=Bosea sp. (in: a-proteobacteria) TaxID=1871050 RepID=UPI0031FED1C5
MAQATVEGSGTGHVGLSPGKIGNEYPITLRPNGAAVQAFETGNPAKNRLAAAHDCVLFGRNF